jgi:hypothetical protein
MGPDDIRTIFRLWETTTGSEDLARQLVSAGTADAAQGGAPTPEHIALLLGACDRHGIPHDSVTEHVAGFTSALLDALRPLDTAPPPPKPQPTGGAAPAGTSPGEVEQPTPDLVSRLADPARCPECAAPVPELYRLQSHYICRECRRWQLHTGVITLPVAGPPGTRPEYVRLTAPYWQALGAPPATAGHRTGSPAGLQAVSEPPSALPAAVLVREVRGLFAFDLHTIFRCAVELGAAVNDQADGATSPEAQIAGERLRRVLNPRQAEFPCNWDWDNFQHYRENGRPSPYTDEPRPGWAQELDLANASPGARQAMLTLGLALADLRGESEWHDRGRELLAAATWHLWDGMEPIDRNVVRDLLPETHRLWGWPVKPATEPAAFDGPMATLSDARVLTPAWRTSTATALDVTLNAMMQTGNSIVDGFRLANGGYFPVYSFDCRPTTAALPSICPKADPKLPVELRAEGDMLADLEARYREMQLIGGDQSIHWVGRQHSPGSICTCELTNLPSTPRPAEWRTLRQLRHAIIALFFRVERWRGQQIPPERLEEIDRAGERVAGLTQALDLELPRFPQLSPAQGFRLRGPASVPVNILDDGITLVATDREVRLWESEWRAIRVAVDARLAEIDARMMSCDPSASLQVDTRQVPLEAPAMTPSPLREAFEAVAQALFQSAELRRCPPTGRLAFEQQARTLSDAYRTARERYALAELYLRAVADDNGRCAFQDALSAVCRVNDAAGHVMLNIVPFHRATAHLLDVPAFDLAELLRAMRRQTSRAALQLLSATTENNAGRSTRAAPSPGDPANATSAKGRHEELPARRELNVSPVIDQLRDALNDLLTAATAAWQLEPPATDPRAMAADALERIRRTAVAGALEFPGRDSDAWLLDLRQSAERLCRLIDTGEAHREQCTLRLGSNVGRVVTSGRDDLHAVAAALGEQYAELEALRGFCAGRQPDGLPADPKLPTRDGAGSYKNDVPHADGPEGGRWVWWNNKRHEVPQGNVYRMIAYMWVRDSATFDDLVGPVFDDPVEPQTIRSCANKVKNALLPTGVPWRLKTDAVSRFITKKAAR